MTPDFIKETIRTPGDVITKHENGVTYHLKELCKVQINGEWVQGVIYFSIIPKAETYCRAIDDFEKFTYQCNHTINGPR